MSKNLQVSTKKIDTFNYTENKQTNKIYMTKTPKEKSKDRVGKYL